MHDERESAFQALLIEAGRYAGYLVYHTHNSKRSEPGFPDLCFAGRRVFFAECKAARGKLSLPQARWLLTLINARQEAYLWRPEHRDEALRVIGGTRCPAAIVRTATEAQAIIEREEKVLASKAESEYHRYKGRYTHGHRKRRR